MPGKLQIDDARPDPYIQAREDHQLAWGHVYIQMPGPRVPRGRNGDPDGGTKAGEPVGLGVEIPFPVEALTSRAGRVEYAKQIARAALRTLDGICPDA